MKKNTFLVSFFIAALLMGTSGFSAEIDDNEAHGAKYAVSGEKQEPSAEGKTAPLAIASVKSEADLPKTVQEKSSFEGASAEASMNQASVSTDEKRSVPVSSKPEDMEKRWNALFSKEITPGSISYTVKSGDSLYVIASKNHTTVALIKKLNNLKNDNIYPDMKLKLMTAPFSMTVDKSDNTLTLSLDGQPIKKYSVATGKKNSTPAGDFKIVNKLVHPTWFKTGAILPPGSPKNALGTRWMGFDKPAYGIHGTIEPKTIGAQASEGCIRMLNEDVEEIYDIVPVGTQVKVEE